MAQSSTVNDFFPLTTERRMPLLELLIDLDFTEFC